MGRWVARWGRWVARGGANGRVEGLGVEGHEVVVGGGQLGIRNSE